MHDNVRREFVDHPHQTIDLQGGNAGPSGKPGNEVPYPAKVMDRELLGDHIAATGTCHLPHRISRPSSSEWS